MCDYQKILSDWDFLMYHHCIIHDIPLDQMLYMGFCYEDLISEFWDTEYSEEQIISIVNEFHAWVESTRNTKEEILDENMIPLTEINDLSELESLI